MNEDEYVPRLKAPEYNNPYWVKTTSGGYNQCIYGSNGAPEVIPNCTGYAHGRWMELANITTDNLGLSFANADSYYSNSDSSLVRGQVPQLGAVICFNMPTAGHVAIVEQIIDDDTIVCSESDWGGNRFSIRTRRREWGWSYYQTDNSYFQGFIYHPNIQPGPGPGPGGKFKWWISKRKIERRKYGF